ncbi:hypothetical protein [Pseudomonas sp. PDM25]|jgi:arginine/lysine/ornithine decarboxylase|uniref:Orn/Lys/Arg family decarboxylase n=1 Tax=Pseudomonas sp. PDM25 TaxID=2854772 RepID=UPI00210F698D|nr:hypothetical protein [Pseudomonas sp. PDM25]
MSRSQTQLPADLAQRYPVLIVANAPETDDNIQVRSVKSIASVLHEHEVEVEWVVLTPGQTLNGQMENSGIPAPLVSSFLSSRGIVVEKTEPYSILVLFSLGVTKGKWGSLIAGLMEFKKHYESNSPLKQVLPDLVDNHAERYSGMGLKDLAEAMHQDMISSQMLHNMDAAFTLLPDPVASPRATYARLVKGEIEQIAVRDMIDRTVAVQIVPYPPGIPLMMPGEKAGADKKAIVDDLLAMELFDGHFPGFEHDNHGVEIERNSQGRPIYKVYVVKNQDLAPCPTTSNQAPDSGSMR